METEYYQKSDDMNRQMAQMKLEPQSLRVAVRELILRSKASMAEQARRNVLKTLTGSLAGEVACVGPAFIKNRMVRTLHTPCPVSNACLAGIITSMSSLTVSGLSAPSVGIDPDLHLMNLYLLLATLGTRPQGATN